MYGCESWTIKKAESTEELMFLNCGVGEDSWESLGQQGDPTIPSYRRLVLGVHWKDWCWSWNSNTLATWCKELTHLKRPWCLERLRAGERDDRGWDGWMASPTQRTWVWVNSGSWWRTGRPGVLWFTGVTKSQTRLSDWIELNWKTLLLLYWNNNSNMKVLSIIPKWIRHPPQNFISHFCFLTLILTTPLLFSHTAGSFLLLGFMALTCHGHSVLILSTHVSHIKSEI